MKGLAGAEVRRAFLSYFQERGHTIVPSSSLVPRADPTLLFTNAGMVQFKDVFLGTERRPYSRATTAQKCVRAGGKHNDLENVGYTARHHTFFEMLGNFSFGDYFKEKAIEYGWEFLTVDLGMPPAQLWATIYQEDDEAFDLWQKITDIPAERIVRMGKKDNFWQMGDTGPCGPCSEVVIDQGPGHGCGRPSCDITCGCDRYLELWNLVFMQFDLAADGTMTPLPKPSIDTGAGLERITAVLQGVKGNFETDLLRPILGLVEELTGKAYGADPRGDISMRVIADHARATAFLMTDGVLPSNEGRGYVLRRILRRGLRHGVLLGLTEPFMHRVTGMVVELMREAYPELGPARERVARETLAEEHRFGHTLRNAIPRLEELIEAVKAARPRGDWALPGGDLFRLYDTYGLPRDIVEDVAAEQGIACDWAGFEAELEGQRRRAREGAGEKFKGVEVAPVLRELGGERATQFLGYDRAEADAEVVAIAREARPVDALRAGEEGEVVLDRTPFYAEAGGQVADTGALQGDTALAEILDVQRPLPGLFVHRVRVTRGTIRRGDRLWAAVDAGRRAVIMKNHTATHLLHEALRRVLGDHVRQEGSLVAPDRLRFDFRHFGPLTADEMGRIEAMVNRELWKNLPVLVEEGVTYEEALARGAKAFFADKYGERVRVVAIPDFGLELCGGTHVRAIGEIGIFKIAAEGGVAAGVRRIEAYTGPGAYDHLRQEEETLRESAEVLRTRPEDLSEKAAKLTTSVRELEREVHALRSRVARAEAERALQKAEMVDGVMVVAFKIPDADGRTLREATDFIKQKAGTNCVTVVASAPSAVSALRASHPLLVVAVTADLVGVMQAGHLVKEVAAVTGGSGGGRPDLAEGAAKDPAKIDDALAAVPRIVRRALEGASR